MQPRKANAAGLAMMLAVLFCFGAPTIRGAESGPTNLGMLQLPLYNADSTPAVAADGTIYQATFEGYLLAVTPQGGSKWEFQINSEIKSSPAIAEDGTIYFGARDWKLYAVNAKGGLKWTFPTGGWVDSSPAIGADGTIYFSSTDGTFYALRPNGTERWRLHTGGATASSPVLDENGNIYLAADKIGIAISSEGKKRMDFAYSALLVDATPAVAANGDIYCSTPWRKLVATCPRKMAR